MFKKILVPVDLSHIDKIRKALDVAANLAKTYDVPAVFVGVTPTTPTDVAHDPREYATKLAAFVEAEAAKVGITAESKVITNNDPNLELDAVLPKAVKETGADLVVMGSHVPNIFDRFWHSHGETLAAHTDASIFLVR